jgi:Cu/Ag efflux protein CusF
MNKTTWFGTAATLAALLLAGCGERAPTDGARRDAEMRIPTGDLTEHEALGTINSFDAAEGTVNISHEPVPSADWPAMTMNFQLADPELAAAARPGERVEFRFTLGPGGSATVTGISSARDTD